MVFVVSTTGQGDTPDSMKVCWDSIVNIKKIGGAQVSMVSNLFCFS